MLHGVPAIDVLQDLLRVPDVLGGKLVLRAHARGGVVLPESLRLVTLLSDVVARESRDGSGSSCRLGL